MDVTPIENPRQCKQCNSTFFHSVAIHFPTFLQIYRAVVILVRRFAVRHAKTSWKLVKRCKRLLIHCRKVDVDHLCHINHFGNAFYRAIIIQCNRPMEHRKSVKLASIRLNCIAVTKHFHRNVAVFAIKPFRMVGLRRAMNSTMIVMLN